MVRTEDRRVNIKSTDMPEELQKEAVQTAQQVREGTQEIQREEDPDRCVKSERESQNRESQKNRWATEISMHEAI